MIHVHQCFNAVGHGTFFSGLAWSDELPQRPFSWVYDCGSKRTTRIDQEISHLEQSEYWPDEIDLLVLSHFDDDHVNGVERFLRTRRVRVLALPYMDVAQRLMNSAAVVGESCSASTALFQLDPVRWLGTQGLSERVDSILFVRGGPRRDGDPPVDADPTPLPSPTPIEESQWTRNTETQDEVFRMDYLAESNAGDASGPRLLLWKHAISTSLARLPVELMFFNSEQPNMFRRDSGGDRVARRSGVPLPALQSEIHSLMHRYGLLDLSRPPRRKWRDALRATYDKHFGRASQNRNNISLCLLVRPLAQEVGACLIFRDRIARSVRVCERAGLLFLGDLQIHREVLDAMRMHFGYDRWNAIAGVQVPHHGSRHSWETGNAAVFAPDWFVHCVPDQSTHHPHQDVNADLKGFRVLQANYRRRVAIDYHF